MFVLIITMILYNPNFAYFMTRISTKTHFHDLRHFGVQLFRVIMCKKVKGANEMPRGEPVPRGNFL